MDYPVNLLLEIQYGRRNIKPHQKIGLAITFEPDELEMQTWYLFHGFWPWETQWNTYLYDWVCLDTWFACFQDGGWGQTPNCFASLYLPCYKGNATRNYIYDLVGSQHPGYFAAGNPKWPPKRLLSCWTKLARNAKLVPILYFLTIRNSMECLSLWLGWS